MNKTFVFLVVAGIQLTSIIRATAQPSPHPYNPDSDGDGYVGVSDVLSVLSYFESYYPIYPPFSSSVLLVSQDGCWNDLQGEQWAGVTWVEPGMDTLFVPYGYDEVVIQSNVNCSGESNNSNLVIFLENQPGANEDDGCYYCSPLSYSQETKVHLSFEFKALCACSVSVKTWNYPYGGWFDIGSFGYYESWGEPWVIKSFYKLGYWPWSQLK